MTRSRWRRRILRSALFGVISSVVLSLALGIIGGNATRCQSATVAWRWRAQFRTSTDYTIHIPPQHDPGDPMDATVARHARLALADTYLAPGAPPPAYAGDAADPGYPVRFISVTTFGIPFESFWGYRASDGLNQTTPGSVTLTTGGNWLPIAFPRVAARATRIFPYLPLWRGLILNAAVHAAAWFALFAAIAALRGSLRSRRGRCRDCGYDRSGLRPEAPCPECGTESKLRATSPG